MRMKRLCFMLLYTIYRLFNEHDIKRKGRKQRNDGEWRRLVLGCERQFSHYTIHFSAHFPLEMGM